MPPVVESDVQVSVIVPARNRPDSLRALLQSLARQSLPAGQFEVIVIDDGSSPPLESTDKLLAAENQRLHRQAHQGPAAARNTGARQSRGKLLAFIDDDCVADKGWLRAMLRAHERTPEALLGGATVNGLTHNIYSSVSESLLAFLDIEALRTGASPTFLAGNNMACATVLFQTINGFDKSYLMTAGSDRDLCQRWAERQWPLRRCVNAHAAHCHDLTFAGFIRQQYHYGRGAAQFRVKHPMEKSLPTSPGFYLRLLAYPLMKSDWPLWQRVLGVPLALLSQCAVVIGTMRGPKA